MIKKILKITGAVLLLALLTLVYFLLPNEAEKLRSDNNALGYVALLKQAKTSQPNPDVYASSQITPDDPLFEGVLALQRGRYGLAEQKLKPLMEAGNLDAMFWYAETILGSSVNATVEAGDLFVKAAELGNPYAALRLKPGTSDCKRYLGYRCSQDWVEKGETGLKELAAQGDVKAQYYANVIKNPRSEEDYQRNIDLVTQAANQGYYIPLVDNLKRLGNYKSLTQEKKQALVELLKLASNDNFIPAINASYKYIKDRNEQLADEVMVKSASLGSQEAIAALFRFDYQDVLNGNEGALFDAYKYGLIQEQLFNDEEGLKFIGWKMTDGTIRQFRGDEEQQIKLAADEFISNMTPVIYIDELHTEYGKY